MVLSLWGQISLEEEGTAACNGFVSKWDKQTNKHENKQKKILILFPLSWDMD